MNIAIFYHCILSGGCIPIETDFACAIMAGQMKALDASGLLDESDELHIGVNGDEGDRDMARLFVPCPHAQYVVHGKGATTEIPTLAYLRSWLPSHPDWLVLYHHIKGVTHPGDVHSAQWRSGMEQAVVWGWRNCVRDLEHGFDSCGAHWLTPEQFPTLVDRCPFWGGTFWWATARFLLTLPPLPPATWANRFEAESWIGRGPRRPRVKDYRPGWP
jgi:hypothetical protein